MKKGTKRKTVWLTVKGEPNTLRGHFIKAGYRAGFPSTVSKREGKKQCDIPITVWRKYLGQSARFCDTPANWKMIMYGDERGSQKFRELGLPINYPVRTEKSLTVDEARALDFLTRKLTPNPAAEVPTYY